MAVSKIALIIAKKRAADIAKKKVAKVPAGQARAVAKEQMRSSGNRPKKINKRTGLSQYEKSMTEKKFPVSKREFGRGRNPEDIIRGRVIAREEARKKLANAPKSKSTKQPKKEVFLTRGKSIAKRSEVEEVEQRRIEKLARKEKAEIIFKAMSPEQKRKYMARAQVKRAQREENAGKTKYGMDITPRKQLDDKVIERAKELTAQEKNEIARKQAIEFGQRRESDKRAAEGLKARDKMIKNKMKNMTPEQKRRYVNYLRESGW